MAINLGEVDLAIAVNIGILREVFGKLSERGRIWWIACEPLYAFEKGYITIGFGDPGCVDRLNTVLYRVPILNTDRPVSGSDKLVVLLDASVILPEQPGLYREGYDVVRDELADIESFFIPLKRALIPMLADSCGARWTITSTEEM